MKYFIKKQMFIISCVGITLFQKTIFDRLLLKNKDKIIAHQASLDIDEQIDIRSVLDDFETKVYTYKKNKKSRIYFQENIQIFYTQKLSEQKGIDASDYIIIFTNIKKRPIIKYAKSKKKPLLVIYKNYFEIFNAKIGDFL